MAKLAFGRAGYGWDGPPDVVESIDPELAAYLRALHQFIFGNHQQDGELATGGGTGGGATVHAELEGLDADDHLQYLTFERHGEIPGNPHGTTPAEIGAEQPAWNAAALQGIDLNPVEPEDGQVLTYNSAAQQWLPAEPYTDPRTFLELSMSQFNATISAGTSAGLLLLPSDALVFAVLVRNPATIAGISGYQVGTQYRRDAWGTCGNLGLATNAMSGFSINSPIYTGVNPEALYFTALTGSFPANTGITVRVFFWRPPVWP